jgi:hypothetical protein
VQAFSGSNPLERAFTSSGAKARHCAIKQKITNN